MKFEELGLSQSIIDAIRTKGYSTPSPIQAKAIPPILDSRDVMAAAQTGTGKTAGFTLPLLERLAKKPIRTQPNSVRALILTPTRELASQVSENVLGYGKNLPLRSAVVFGGVKINPQMQKLRRGVDILVAIPGRLLDLVTKNAVKLDRVEIFVLDEADRMLDMGFIHDIKKVIALLPTKRQNLLFSATFSPDIRSLAKGLINDPVEVSVAPANTTAEKIVQRVIPVDKATKTKALIKLIKDENWFQVLVFCRTKHGANKLSLQLSKAGISAAPIHGNKSQGARTRALKEFKSGDIQVLVATDIAARGIDINQLPYVVNYDLPHVAEDYVHRIGRTGRAGAEGQAVSLVCAAEQKELFGIERLIRQVIPREELQGFVAHDKLAPSPTTFKPIKPKKPKKAKLTQGKAGETSAEKDLRGKRTKQSNKPKQEKSAKGRSSNNRNAPSDSSTNRNNRKQSSKGRTSNNSGTSSTEKNAKNVSNRRPRKKTH